MTRHALWTRPSPARTAPHYRTIDRSAAVAHLASYCWPFESAEEATARSNDALERLSSLGLEHREDTGRQLFDPVEIFNFIKWAGTEHGDPCWSTWVGAHRRVHAEGRAACPGRFSTTVTRVVPRRPSTRYALARPSGAAYHDHLTLTPAPSPSSDLRIIVEPGYVLARPSAAYSEDHVRISYRADYECSRVTFDLDDARDSTSRAPVSEVYLAPEEGLVRVTSGIRALAATLAPRGLPPHEALRAFWRFGLHEFEIGATHHDALDANDPLMSAVTLGWLDCLLMSSLLVALCRAAQIPARLCTGVMAYERWQSVHYWFEAHLEPLGWVPCDPSSYVLAGPETDPTWSQFGLGKLDSRLTTSTFPAQGIGMKVPLSWATANSAHAGGSSQNIIDSTSGTTVFVDTFSVVKG